MRANWYRENNLWNCSNLAHIAPKQRIQKPVIFINNLSALYWAGSQLRPDTDLSSLLTECCCLLCSMCVLSDFLLTTCSSSILPHGNPFVPYLFPSSKTPQSQSQVSFLSPALSVTAPAFYYPIRDYWRAFFTALGSVQCPRPDCSLVLARHRTNPNRNSAVLDTFTIFP